MLICESTMADLIKMRVSDVLQCSILNWYENFKEYTIQSLILPLPQDVLAYLKEKGTVVLPQGCHPGQLGSSSIGDDDDDDEWDSYENQEEEEAVAPDLKEFNKEIENAISVLGGSVFPKLNFSAPQDARWIGFNYSLKSTSPGDIYLLLKSSCFITHDLCTPFKDCVDKDEVDTSVNYCLVLREWMDINPAHEFRCFVKDQELVGISQRDVTQSFSSVVQDNHNIRHDIIQFWNERIKDKFSLVNYTFDVYRPARRKVILIDFNPFGVTTDSLLFQWHEFRVTERCGVEGEHGDDAELSEDLERLELETVRNGDNRERSSSPLSMEDKPEFRYIGGTTGVQPHSYWNYGLPSDVRDLSSGEDAQKLVDLLQMTQGQQESDSSEDEGYGLNR